MWEVMPDVIMFAVIDEDDDFVMRVFDASEFDKTKERRPWQAVGREVFGPNHRKLNVGRTCAQDIAGLFNELEAYRQAVGPSETFRVVLDSHEQSFRYVRESKTGFEILVEESEADDLVRKLNGG